MKATPRDRPSRRVAVGVFATLTSLGEAETTCAIIEAHSAATLARTTAPFTPWLRFTATAIVPIEEAAGIGGEGVAFRDSVS
jgi:hypothetical protein